MDPKKPIISESFIKKNNILLLIKQIFSHDSRVKVKVKTLGLNQEWQKMVDEEQSISDEIKNLEIAEQE